MLIEIIIYTLMIFCVIMIPVCTYFHEKELDEEFKKEMEARYGISCLDEFE